MRHGTTPSIIPPFVYNWSPATQFPNFRAQRSAMLSGGPRTLIGFSGESTANGYGANSGGNNYRQYSYAAYLASLYGSLGTFDNYMGGGGPNGDNARIAFVGPTPGALAPGVASWGGGCMLGTSAAGDGCNLTWGSGITYNTIRLISLRNGTQFDTGTNGGALSGTLSSATNTGNFAETIWTVSPTTGPTNIRQVGTGSGFVQSVEVYNTASPRYNFLNGAIGGQASSSYAAASTGTTYPAGSLIVKPSLMFLDVGINDGNTYGTAPATYGSNLNTTLAYWASAGIDTILCSPHPISGGDMETGPTYWSSYQAQLIATGRPVISQHERSVSWAALNAKTPSWNFDGLHYNELYGQDFAAYLKSSIIDAIPA